MTTDIGKVHSIWRDGFSPPRHRYQFGTGKAAWDSPALSFYRSFRFFRWRRSQDCALSLFIYRFFTEDHEDRMKAVVQLAITLTVPHFELLSMLLR